MKFLREGGLSAKGIPTCENLALNKSKKIKFYDLLESIKQWAGLIFKTISCDMNTDVYFNYSY